MLYLIGLGINDEKDLTLKGIETAKKCECFIELYTSNWKGSIENLEKIIGEVKKLERSDMEEKSQKLLDLAKEKDVAILIPGDPLAATTHIELILEAKKQKIPYQIIHSVSIFSAIGETGLQLYKFGRTATIPSTKQLEYVKKALEDNKKIGLHTLFLLDIGMNVSKAVKILLENQIISKEEKIIAVQFGKKTIIKYAKPLELDLESPLALIIPGELHFKEKEFLEIL